jgi:hypothetical protein
MLTFLYNRSLFQGRFVEGKFYYLNFPNFFHVFNPISTVWLLILFPLEICSNRVL